MGYYMRYIVADERLLSLAAVGEAISAIDPRYLIRPTDLDELVEVLYDGKLYGQIEMNVPRDDLFEDDITAFMEMIGTPTSQEERLVMATLTAATQIIAVEMFWEGTASEATFALFDPLWDWLFTNRRGILQADTEGFYSADGLLVERKFMI
jgi:hypothetical protein